MNPWTNPKAARDLFRRTSDTGASVGEQIEQSWRPNVVAEAIPIALAAGGALGFLVSRRGLGAVVGAGLGYGALYIMYPPKAAS